jgi:metal-sulfur cluster biosynthetic enzyme
MEDTPLREGVGGATVDSGTVAPEIARCPAGLRAATPGRRVPGMSEGAREGGRMGARADTIVDALRQVIDPCCKERGISVVDMGLIEDVDVDDHGTASVRIVLTSGWCPFQTDLLADITAAVQAVPEVADADVAITLDEPWSTTRLSDDARRKLRFLPEPGEVTDREAFRGMALPVLAGPTTTRS